MDRETFEKAKQIDYDIKFCERAKRDLEAECCVFLERESSTTNLTFDKVLREVMIEYYRTKISMLEEELKKL